MSQWKAGAASHETGSARIIKGLAGPVSVLPTSSLAVAEDTATPEELLPYQETLEEGLKDIRLLFVVVLET